MEKFFKSVLDGSVLGGRIQVILDDILWIATLPQVRSAITFYDHIMNIIKAASKKVPKIYRTNVKICSFFVLFSSLCETKLVLAS